MNPKFMRTLSAGIILALLTTISIPVHADAQPMSKQEQAYIMLRAGQYQQASIPLAEAGQIYISSGNTSLISLGNEYLVLSQVLAQSHIPQYQLGTKHTNISIECIEAILALIAAITAFDAACVSPAIVIALPCIGAIASLIAAADLVGRICT